MPIAGPARGRVHEANLRRRQESGETQRRSRRRVINQRQIHFDILEMRLARLIGVKSSVNDHFNSTVESITHDDVQRVARKYIDLNHLQIVAVGDASKTREVLTKFGSVEEYDSDGKPVRTASKTVQ